MRRSTVVLCTFAALAALAASADARSRSTAAVDAANAAKAGFSARNGPAGPSPEGAGVGNRSIKVVVAAVDAGGRLVIADGDGAVLGSIDPRAIPRLTARDKARFGGRKRLGPDDLAAGQRLKITFRGNTSEILRAKVLKDRG